jgi:hypothetical protein
VLVSTLAQSANLVCPDLIINFSASYGIFSLKSSPSNTGIHSRLGYFVSDATSHKQVNNRSRVTRLRTLGLIGSSCVLFFIFFRYRYLPTCFIRQDRRRPPYLPSALPCLVPPASFAFTAWNTLPYSLLPDSNDQPLFVGLTTAHPRNSLLVACRVSSLYITSTTNFNYASKSSTMHAHACRRSIPPTSPRFTPPSPPKIQCVASLLYSLAIAKYRRLALPATSSWHLPSMVPQ